MICSLRAKSNLNYTLQVILPEVEKMQLSVLPLRKIMVCDMLLLRERSGNNNNIYRVPVIYCVVLISGVEVSFDNASSLVMESDSEVEICLVLNGSIADPVTVTIGIWPNGEQMKLI